MMRVLGWWLCDFITDIPKRGSVRNQLKIKLRT